MNNIEFDEQKHIYKVNGVQIPSVTTIIRDVFGNKYVSVPEDVLARACNKGTVVHKEIEDYIKTGTLGFSEEFSAAEQRLNGLKDKIASSEQYLYAKTPYGEFCGTCDLMLLDGTLIDYKTSRVLDKESVTRQLNMYAYAKRKEGVKVNKLEAWHLVGDKLKVVGVPLYSDDYAEGIMKAYSEGRTLKSDSELTVSEGKCEGPDTKTLLEACKKIKELDTMIESLQAQRDKLSDQIKAFMALNSLTESDNDVAQIRLIPGGVRRSFDSAKFKKEHEDIYNAYQKEVQYKDTLRIKYL